MGNQLNKQSNHNQKMNLILCACAAVAGTPVYRVSIQTRLGRGKGYHVTVEQGVVADRSVTPWKLSTPGHKPLLRKKER